MEGLCKIVFPAPAKNGGWAATQGTKVLASDGAEIKGVTKIVIVGAVNDIWRAEIHCLVQPPEVSDLMTFVYKKFIPSRWQRFKIWLRFGPRDEATL